MRNLLIALMLIAVAALDAIAQTTDETPGHVKVESQRLSSPPSPVHPSMSASITHNARDCDGQSSMKDSVTALISRLVRSSTVVRGVQCPIPAPADTSQLEELRP
jgi:hypothetical protein